MKINISKNSKKVITLDDMPVVKQIIKDFKDDEITLKEYGLRTARIASGAYGFDFEILKASAEIAKNQRIYNQFCDNSKNLDVWFNFYAFNNYYGFYEIGAYLSDLWQSDGTEETYKYIRSNMYINHYKRI